MKPAPPTCALFNGGRAGTAELTGLICLATEPHVQSLQCTDTDITAAQVIHHLHHLTIVEPVPGEGLQDWHGYVFAAHLCAAVTVLQAL